MTTNKEVASASATLTRSGQEQHEEAPSTTTVFESSSTYDRNIAENSSCSTGEQITAGQSVSHLPVVNVKEFGCESDLAARTTASPMSTEGINVEFPDGDDDDYDDDDESNANNSQAVNETANPELLPPASFSDTGAKEERPIPINVTKGEEEPPDVTFQTTMVTDDSFDSNEHENNENKCLPPQQPKDGHQAHDHESYSHNHRDPLNPCWTRFTEKLHAMIRHTVTRIALHAAGNPWRYVVGSHVLAIGLLLAGILTNFTLIVNTNTIFTPMGSRQAQQKEWIESDDGFPNATRKIILLMHNDGQNVLHVRQMERVFEALDTVRHTPGYTDLCAQGPYIDIVTGQPTCRIMSPTGFWDHHNVSNFRTEIETDIQLRQVLSGYQFANGVPVYHDAILGNSHRGNDNNNTTVRPNQVLQSAESYLVTIELPNIVAPERDSILPSLPGMTRNGEVSSDAFETKMLQRLNALRKQWKAQDQEAALLADENTSFTLSTTSSLTLDLHSIYAYETEFLRAILADFYLIPLTALMMAGFIGFCFWKADPQPGCVTRVALGYLSVYTIALSYIAGHGLMFICGVPYTTLTQAVAFLIIGVGLDDSFIITGAYFRTSPQLPPVERIRITMEEVAHSISLTTITTMFAFALGLMSSFPGIGWLCAYALTTVGIDFVFQITLFIAFMVLDEQRIASSRRDVLCCFKKEFSNELDANGNYLQDASKAGMKGESNGGSTAAFVTGEFDTEEDVAVREEAALVAPEQSFHARFMSRYADILLTPVAKKTTLVFFAALFAVCLYSATLLEQQFLIGDWVPDDSSLKDVTYSLENYASIMRPVAVYFRHIDQTDEETRQEMIDYVNELEALPQLSGSVSNLDISAYAEEGASNMSEDIKPFCWVRDFHRLQEEFSKQLGYDIVSNLNFTQQLDLALAQPLVREVYGQDIVRDEHGNITASRCWLFLTDFDMNSVESQVGLMADHEEVSRTQLMNKSRGDDWACFFYDIMFFYWVSFEIVIRELIITIISGIVALAVIAVFLMPHWSACIWVTFMISILYSNFMGVLQAFGMYIHGIFYVGIVIAIGLLVDFIMHILLRYYETSPSKNRDARVKETLISMGASVFLGGFTTFLGVLPMAFASTEGFKACFKVMFGMIILGISHGLVLLPVLLSMFGPTTGLLVHETTRGDTLSTATMNDDHMKSKSIRKGPR